MAVVPRVTVPPTEVRPLPGGRRDPSAPAAAFGALQAAATQETGKQLRRFASVLAEGALRLKNRQDSVARANSLDGYRTILRDSFNQEMSEGSDFGSEEALTTFTTQANEAAQKVLSEHSGSTGSRLALSEMLIRERSKFTDAAVGRSLQTQLTQTNRQLTEAFSTLANTGGQAPETVGELFREVDLAVANYAGQLTPTQEETFRKAGKEMISVTAMETMMALGQLDKVEDALKAGTAFLSESTSRQFRNRITIRRLDGEREAQRVAARVKRLETTLGRKLNPREALAAEGINLPSAPATKPTLSAKIFEFETAIGRPANEAEIQSLAGVDVGEGEGGTGVFGKGARGLGVEFLATNSSDFSLGRLSPIDDRLFFAAATSLVTQIDPITGQPGRLDPITREAFMARGFDPDRLGEPSLLDPEAARRRAQPFLRPDPAAAAGGAPTAPTIQEGTVVGRAAAAAAGQPPGITPGVQPAPGVQPTDQPGGQAAQVTRPAPGGAIDPTGQASAIAERLSSHVDNTRQFAGGMLAPGATEPPATLFEAAESLTGPISGLQQAVSGTAFIGDLFGAPEVRRARRFMETFKQDFVRILQNNPRYPIGERNAILAALDIESKFIGNPTGFRDDLIGMDEALELRQANAQQIIATGRVGRAERESALNVFNLIRKARTVIGAQQIRVQEFTQKRFQSIIDAAPEFKDRAAVDKAITAGELRPGDAFKLPDGNAFRVPAQPPRSESLRRLTEESE